MLTSPKHATIDGVVLASMPTDDPLLETERPFVVQGRDPYHDNVAFIDVDNLESSRHATLHLARLGRRRIAHITGPLNTAVGQDRRQGYESALGQSGLPYNPALIAEGDFTYEGGYQAMKHLLPHNPDSVFVASDTMTQGALHAILEIRCALAQPPIEEVNFENICKLFQPIV